MDSTDDRDADYNVASGRNGVWTPGYLCKFTKLLLENTVVLQPTQRCLKDDPVHQLRKKALEHMQTQLNLKSVDQVRNRINCFRKVAANKLRKCVAKSPGRSPADILKTAPRWLRELEPHLNLWTRAINKLVSRQSSSSSPVTQPVEKPLVDPVTGLALQLVEAARSARSLDARVVCSSLQLPGLPQHTAEELQYVWWRMLDVARQKLVLLRDAGDVADELFSTRFCPVEYLLVDLLMLFDDNICTVYEIYDSMQTLVSLFHLAQLHRLEEPAGDVKARWRRAHRSYRETCAFPGSVCSSIIVMQRRWHEMKCGARRAIAEYAKGGGSPSPLYAAMAKRFPHIVTEPIVSWREMVETGAVVEDDSEGTDVDEEPVKPSELESVNYLTVQDLRSEPFERFAARHSLMTLSIRNALDVGLAKEDEDDIILIEKEIETIDLITTDDNNSPETELRLKRQQFADKLEKDLDGGLKDIQNENGASRMAVLHTDAPKEDTIFIYNSSDEEVIESNQDRLAHPSSTQMNTESIGSQFGNKTNSAIAVKIKTESVVPEGDTSNFNNVIEMSDGTEINNKQNVADNEVDGDNAFDEKLLMVTKISLVNVSETPEWRKFAVKRKNSININNLDLRMFAPKRAKAGGPKTAQDLSNHTFSEGNEVNLPVKVKIERRDDEGSCDHTKGERQVKSMAKKLISELMRDESEAEESEGASVPRRRRARDMIAFAESDDQDDDVATRVIKKVKLPDIHEVRRNNKSMLMAQVAPLHTDGDGETNTVHAESEQPEHTEVTAVTDTESTVSTDSLHIDERDNGLGSEDNISKWQLDRVLQKLAEERSTGAAASPLAVVCCTARRQRALHAARSRASARAHRPPPPYLDIHTSRCAKGCDCCCKHLLTDRVAGTSAKLQQQAREIKAALSRLLGENTIPTTEESGENTNRNKKTRPTSKKKPTETAHVTEIDPLKEWIRQKNLTSQYFNLNLKTKPAEAPNRVAPNTKSPERIREIPRVPATSAATEPNVVHNPNIPPQKLVLNSVEGKGKGSKSKIVYPQVNPKTIHSASTTVAVPKIMAYPTIRSNRIHTSIYDVVASPLRSGPGTFVKLAPSTKSTAIPTPSTIQPVKSSRQLVVPLSISSTVAKLSSGIKVQSSMNPESATPSRSRNSTELFVQSVKSSPTSGQLCAANNTLNALSMSRSVKPLKPDSLSSLPPPQPTAAKFALKSVNKACKPFNSLLPARVTVKTNIKNHSHSNSTEAPMAKIARKPQTIPVSDINQASDVNQAYDINQASNVNQASDVNQDNDVNLIHQVERNQHSHGNETQLALCPCVTRDTVLQPQDIPRGTGIKVFKISSMSHPVAGLPVPSEPRSLLREPPEARAGRGTRRTRVLVISKDGTRFTKEINVQMNSKSLVGTKVLLNKRPSPSPANPPVPPLVNITKRNSASGDSLIISSGNNDGGLAIPLQGCGDVLSRLSGGTGAPPTPSPYPSGGEGDAHSAATTSVAIIDDSHLGTNSCQLERYYRRRDMTIPLDEFLRHQDPTNIVIQCFGDTMFTVRGSYYVLRESEPAESRADYWSMGPVPGARRLLTEPPGPRPGALAVRSVERLNGRADGGSGVSAVLSSPSRMCLDNKVYVKLKDNPLLYARVMRAVCTAGECAAELRRGATLLMCDARTGRLVPLTRDTAVRDKIVLYSVPLPTTLLKELTTTLNDVSDQELPAAGAGATAATAAVPSRTDVNARADVVMMMNNVNRKPIEMVYVDSDDEGSANTRRKEKKFQGLEDFEDLDVFEL